MLSLQWMGIFTATDNQDFVLRNSNTLTRHPPLIQVILCFQSGSSDPRNPGTNWHLRVLCAHCRWHHLFARCLSRCLCTGLARIGAWGACRRDIGGLGLRSRCCWLCWFRGCRGCRWSSAAVPVRQE